MIVENYPIPAGELPCPEHLFPSDAVFFDIETTGLSHRASHLYMIGAICRIQGQLRLIQWFLQKPSEEKEMLVRFSELLKDYSTVIHYNGQSFDLPYLSDRCRYWELEDPFQEHRIRSLDLYRNLRPLKQLLKLPSMKQKDLETLLQVPRTDEMSGKELISVYHRYLEQAGEEELKLLLLHNHDDLTGMLSIYALYACLTSPAETSLPEAKLEQETLTLTFTASCLCPAELEFSSGPAGLSVCGDRLTLTVSGIRGCFRHYYSNYRDYYYLPLEDTAIHKSVGVYVDPSCRQKAKADNCYTKKEGLFFFQPEPVILPEFRQDSRKGPSYFSSDQLEQDPSVLQNYAASLLNWLLPVPKDA